MVTDAISDYEWNRSEVNRLDRLTQDYLHRLELENLDYRERAKVATQLSKCRQLRRASKDTVEILEPFIEFIESEKGKQTMNLMREALGKTRKVEKYMENRTYRYKVLEGPST
jgi:Na+/phosphate symporter